TDLRGLAEMCFDFFDCPDKLEKALDIIQQNALQLITAQVEAGAHCIGIGDAACSQIGPELYREHAWAREKQLVEHIHSLGAIAKLHICGDTTALVPDMVATGADIVDIDHLATNMGSFATHLGEGQVLCGNPDPVEIVEQGTPERILSAVAGINRDTGGRTIVSAGCEITPGTSDENLRALGEAARRMDGMP
ncbi:MAG: hypothetical protein KAI66_22440, partial [Lentisphaeria bacterium]|nr:hypothetical protein [Lentisphaeria bacterium]